MDEDSVAFAGVAGQAALLAAGTVTSVDLVTMLLRRIERFDPRLRAFRLLLADSALEAARAADRARADGDARPLLGVPIAVKDNLDVAGTPTRLGTRSNEPPAAADAELVSRLRAAGMVVVGKTNLPELALWGFTEAPGHGVTRNPWALDRVPGGSSGGSAAAVAAGLVPAAHATDGGGSIRIPAAACGLVGLKPTHGLVPMEPVADHWYGMSHAGFLTRTVEDTALLLSTLAPSTSPRITLHPVGRPPRLRIAYSTRPPVRSGAVSDDVRAAVTTVATLLRDAGHHVVERDPRYGDILGVFIPRYLRGASDDLRQLAQPRATERRTRTIAALGRLVSRRRIRASYAGGDRLTARMRDFFTDVDVLVTPTTLTPPIPAGRPGAGLAPTLRRLSGYVPYTQPWNITGQPAMSLPVAWTGGGLPVAVQLVGRHDEEATLLQVGRELEAALDWPRRRPPL